MLEALIAIVVTLVVLAIVILIVYSLRNRKKSSHVKSGKHIVNSIQTVGVASEQGGSMKKQSGTVRVSSSQFSSGMVSEKVKARFTALGVFAVAIFGTLAAKAFSMQVLSGDEYTKKAQQNLYTSVSTAAPRGRIYDAEGSILVRNRASLTVLADSEVANDRSLVQRLSVLLGIPHNIVRQRIQDTSSGAQSQRVVASDVTLRDVAFISEHADAFPGIVTQTRTVREYPWGALAAHVLGYTGPVSTEDQKVQTAGSNVELGDAVGKGGVEASYDNLLAGDHGKRTVLTDADGTILRVVSEIEPTKGNDVYLTVNAAVQQVADKALAELIAPKGSIGSGKGTAGALVCIDATTGGIVALANYPTYTPESFIGGISQEVWDLFNTEGSHYPLLNRSIAGTYPAASTFKAFTGMAGIEYGFADTVRQWDCQGVWTGFGSQYPQACWNTSGHGHLNFHEGVVISCDVVFYEIAKSFYEGRGTIGNTAMQDFIMKFGFGKTTGVDLAGEAAGRVPTPEWKAAYFKDAPEQATWLPGDLSNMSIGQGYVLVTPLQMAMGYAAVATGNILKPHVLKEVKNSQGETVLAKEPEIVAKLDIPDDHFKVMREALRGVATDDATVSAQFRKYGIAGAAKTGTAEVAGKKDFGWFACYAPFDNPKYVVACVIEEGTAGAQSACPVSVQVLDAALRADAGTLDKTLTAIPGATQKTVAQTTTSTTETDSTYSGRTD